MANTVVTATNTANTAVLIRRRPAFRKQHDNTTTFICISPEVERVADYTMPNGVHIDYPVVVSVISENALVLEGSGLNTVLDLRQTIRRALHVTTFNTVAEVFDISSYDPNPAFPTDAFDQAFDVSAQRFTYRANEVRTA